jgi:hypothetical protein
VLSAKGVTNLVELGDYLGDYLGECSRRTEGSTISATISARARRTVGRTALFEGQAESWHGERRPTDAYNIGDTSHFSSVCGTVALSPVAEPISITSQLSIRPIRIAHVIAPRTPHGSELTSTPLFHQEQDTAHGPRPRGASPPPAGRSTLPAAARGCRVAPSQIQIGCPRGRGVTHDPRHRAVRHGRVYLYDMNSEIERTYPEQRTTLRVGALGGRTMGP